MIAENMTQEWTTLEVGDKAPNFEAEIGGGSMTKLSDVLAQGNKVILYFYPKDNTSGCTTEAVDFRDSLSLFEGAGYKVLGVSKDSAKSHQNFTDKHELNFPLAVDTSLELQNKFGVWQEKTRCGKTSMGTVRSTFIIGTDGKVEYAEYNVKAKGHVERLKAELGLS